MPMGAKVGAAWKDITTLSVKISSSWQPVVTGSVKVGGTWQKFYPSVTVSARADGDYNVRYLSTTYQGIQFNTSGTEYEYLWNNTQTNATTWLDTGTSAEVWVLCTVTAGGWDTGTVGSRVQCNSSPTWKIVQSSVGESNVTCYFRFYDAASGGNLLQTTSSSFWSAEQTG